MLNVRSFSVIEYDNDFLTFTTESIHIRHIIEPGEEYYNFGFIENLIEPGIFQSNIQSVHPQRYQI